MKLILDKNNRNRFIEENMQFIYNTANTVCKRRVDKKNDDEVSIAMIAFDKACTTYDEDKGNFFGYAKTLIKNSLIDFFRKEKRTPELIFEAEDEGMDYVDYKLSMKQYHIEREGELRAQEIAQFQKELTEYKLKFSDLVESSPSHADTKNSLLNLAFECIRNEQVLETIKSKKRLPVKEICLLTTANRKFIDKWRRYLLALIIILSNEDYLYLRSYLNIKRVGVAGD